MNEATGRDFAAFPWSTSAFIVTLERFHYYMNESEAQVLMVRSKLTLSRGLAILALLMGSFCAQADSYTVDPDASLFAIVTHKAGIASRLGHNLLIYPEEYEATLDVDAKNVTSAALDLKLAVDTLTNANDEVIERWYPSLEALGILSETLQSLSETKSEKIRETMLSAKQLDVESFPIISASIQDIRPGAVQLGPTTFSYIARIALTVVGKTVVQNYPANITFEGDTVTIEATGSVNFTDFGIKPYSALLGAIRNQDAFDVYVNITATKNL